VAIGAALSRPWASVVLSGAATPEHLESNLAGLDVAWDPSFDRRVHGFAETPADYWRYRSTLAWA
jgi:aryl-alcohol dehydrogenase-like predicted oxidoreductase